MKKLKKSVLFYTILYDILLYIIANKIYKNKKSKFYIELM